MCAQSAEGTTGARKDLCIVCAQSIFSKDIVVGCPVETFDEQWLAARLGTDLHSTCPAWSFGAALDARLLEQLALVDLFY